MLENAFETGKKIRIKSGSNGMWESLGFVRGACVDLLATVYGVSVVMVYGTVFAIDTQVLEKMTEEV